MSQFSRVGNVFFGAARHLPVAVGMTALLTVACSSGGHDDPADAAAADASSVCTPNASIDCTCDNGGKGTQTCNSSGSAFGSCTGCTPGPCSNTNPTGSCPTGSSCIAGACCDATRACGTACCSADEQCIDWHDGKAPRCSKSCGVNGDCPFDPGDGTKCCRMFADTTKSVSKATGVCGPSATDSCRCAKAADCKAGQTCAPSVLPSGATTVVSGAYVCVASDGATNHGCGGCPVCSSASAGFADCQQDSHGNQFCGRSCLVDSDCLNPGVACCKPATCKNCATSCAKSGVCVPCGS